MQSESASRKAADDRRHRKALEEHAQKWRRARSLRDRFTHDEMEAERLLLEAEIMALVAAGEVKMCPDGWAKGSTGNSIFAD
jgi:hypothetical protein